MKKSKIDIRLVSEENQRSIIKKLLAKCKEDNELNELLLQSEDYMTTFNNSYVNILGFITDREDCINCKGYNHCNKYGRKGFKIKLINNKYSNELETFYTPCEEYNKILRIFNNIIYCDVDKFAILNRTNQSKDIIKNHKNTNVGSYTYVSKQCLSMINKYNQTACHIGYLISSENHNAESIGFLMAYAFARKNRTVAVIDAKVTLNQCSSLNKEMKEDGDNNMAKAMKADVMVIINLGFEYKSQAARDLVLTPLLMDRSRQGKLTFITSSLTYDEILSTYSKDTISRKLFKRTIDKIVTPLLVEDKEYFN